MVLWGLKRENIHAKCSECQATIKDENSGIFVIIIADKWYWHWYMWFQARWKIHVLTLPGAVVNLGCVQHGVIGLQVLVIFTWLGRWLRQNSCWPRGNGWHAPICSGWKCCAPAGNSDAGDAMECPALCGGIFRPATPQCCWSLWRNWWPAIWIHTVGHFGYHPAVPAGESCFRKSLKLLTSLGIRVSLTTYIDDIWTSQWGLFDQIGWMHAWCWHPFWCQVFYAMFSSPHRSKSPLLWVSRWWESFRWDREGMLSMAPSLVAPWLRRAIPPLACYQRMVSVHIWKIIRDWLSNHRILMLLFLLNTSFPDLRTDVHMHLCETVVCCTVARKLVPTLSNHF